MITDARKLAFERPFDVDLCIIGGGAVGITLARALAGHSAKVCVIESGGLKPTPETRALNEGEVVGHDYNLTRMRGRYFGGSTGLWSGWCRPLEPMDFEPRPWVPASGWPIRREELDPASDDICSMIAAERTTRYARPGRGRAWARLYVRSEQQPNPDSRISLSDSRDALGLRRVKHDWRLTALDKRTVRETNRIMGLALGRAGLGRLKGDSWLVRDDDSWENMKGWAHPLGTTRMSESPNDGVVNRDCRVHTVDNLYVTGGSVFPTSGTAHPTLTIVALAYRLADHLRPGIAS